MGKLEKGFAVGAVAAAAVLGAVLYALYPDGFNPSYAKENGAASTEYSGMQDKSGASQESDGSAGTPTSPPPSSSPSPPPSSSPGY
jgi:hypothetical protein